MSGIIKIESMTGIVNLVSRWFNYMGVGVLTIMMLLTVSDVFMRFLFNSPILGTLELTEYLMIPVVYFGLAWCAVRRKNVKVDILVTRLSTKPRVILDSITCFLSLVVMVLITWQNFKETIYVFELSRVSDILHIHAYPFYIVLTLGCFLLCIVLLTNLIENVVQGVSKK
jgi:TRAP-type C4-dicarboxylate transport system permease small subunit